MRSAFDPTKPRGPQIASAIWQAAFIIGGPVLGLITIRYYPFLVRDRSLYIGGIVGIVVLFLASFACIGKDDFPRGMPLITRLLSRLGLGLCGTSLLLGLVGIVNGYGTRLVTREAPVVSKHQTLERNPARRTNYVAVRAWPSSRTVVELEAPWQVYDRLKVPVTAVDTPGETLNAMADAGYVTLVIGEGRFGVEWLKRIDPPYPDQSSR